MKLLIIQIGDIHIKDHNNVASLRLRSVAKAIKHIASDVTTVVVALSGDIAFSGKKEEYAIASTSFKAMLTDIAIELEGVSIHLIGVPGNHDCDFEHSSIATRKLLLEGLARSSREKVDENTLGICCQLQNEFFAFLDQHQTLKTSFGVARACYNYLIPVGSEQVLFRCINTAFSSTLPEVAGQMIYPLSLLQERPIEQAPTYSIAIFHHPYNWLTPTIKRAFSEHIESACDLIFTLS